MLVAPVVSTRGGSWPPVAPAVSVSAAAHIHASRPYPGLRGCAGSQRRPPGVSTRSGSRAFGRAKG